MMAPRSACLILHGKAAMREDVRAAVRRCAKKVTSLTCMSRGREATRRAFRQASHDGVELVIAGGGDGTVNEVVKGLLDGTAQSKPRSALAILPLGTANDLARACGIPLDPFAALRLALSGVATPVDVGQANGRSFMNVATGGFGTQVTVATPNELKKILGGAAYFLTGVTHFSSIRPAHGRLSGPGFAWDGGFPRARCRQRPPGRRRTPALSPGAAERRPAGRARLAAIAG